MSEAFVCDRCGDYGESPPKRRVADRTGPGGNVDATVNTSDTSIRQGVGSVSTPTASTSIQGGDLCPECADKYDEFWKAGDAE
jgi:hypothetical protein